MPLEIVQTSNPICPICDHELIDAQSNYSLLLDKWGTRECDFCGIEFHVKMETVYSTKLVK